MATVSADVLSHRIPAGVRDGAAAARLTPLDSLCGLAALSVVACHYLLLLQNTPLGRHVWQWLWIPPLSLFRTAYGSVILFFVLSGYVLALSLLGERRTSWSGFALRRFCRIWPPFAVTIITSFMIGHVALATEPVLPSVWQANTWHGDDITLAALRDQIMMISSHTSLDVAAWSLIHELRISLAFPLLLIFLRRAPTGTLIASLCLHVASRHGPLWLSALVPDTAAYIVYFAAGAWLALNRTRLATLIRATPLAKALLCAIALLLLSVPGDNPYSGIFAGVGATLMIAIVAASTEIARALSAPWCEFLGRISYSLYLTHVVVLMALGRMLGESLPVWLILIVATPIIGVVTLAVYRWVEQPSIGLGRMVAPRFAWPRVTLALAPQAAIRADVP